MKEVKTHIVDKRLVAVQNTVYINPNKITIKWFTNEGNLIDDDFDGKISSHLWEAHIEGIDTEAIRFIEYPKISYDGAGDYLVKVVYDVYEK